MRRLLTDPDPASAEPPSGAPDVDLDEAYAYPAEAARSSFVRSNFVCSADGAAEVGGRSGPLGGPADRRVFQLLRWLSDVVLVGAGTARHENYGAVVVPAERRERRRAAGLAEVPPVAVVTASAGLDPAARLFAVEVRPIVLTCAAAPPERRAALSAVADVVVCGEQTVELVPALAALAERGLTRVLTEGGPTLHAQLGAAGLLDELCLTVAPLLAGPGRIGIGQGQPWAGPVAMRLVHLLTEDDSLFLRYRRA
ncbi:pyrimidine reductase family protein [Frankia sp. AgB32]|uniref:pyrimidine reductase family protein n=1 Tax=Frankia sp. AgB32 TaxID=631119 RepID=UPI00200C4A5E|nr:pyrimidine reductase family protein [Frankia sp. AgB32]MCK9895467.1 pyrimidine reductase family protein [Frankia sp. AgB32]